MRKTIIAFLILTLLVPQGLYSVVLAEDNGGKSVSQGRELTWDKDGEALEVQNNDIVTVKKTAQGTLSVPDNTTITIVGSVKSGAKGVGFYIGSGAKVRWGAEYCGAKWLMGAYGEGTLEIIKGALIENTSKDYDTISSAAEKLRIVMNGGTVRTKGAGSSIFTPYSDVTINGGTIENSGENGSTITCRDITINGGRVSGLKDTYMTIYAIGVKANGKDDPNHGNVTVHGGVISSENHIAIQGSGTVFVKGGTVSSTGEEPAIHGGSNDYGGIKVSGGIVTSTSRDCCLLSNNISVSGGVVYSSKAHALSSDGAGARSRSNGTIQTMASSKGKAKVSGGLILARGKKLSDVVDTKSVKVSTSKSKGIICTWNKKGKSKYTRGTKTNLKVYTPKASVRWGKDGKLSGLRYKKGSDKGFVRIKGVTVVNPKPKKTQFTYSLKSKKYDGGRKSISVTPKKGVGNVTAIYYQGVGGTKYKKNKMAPKKVGTYKVTINVATGKQYKAVKGLSLGKFKIKKAS